MANFFSFKQNHRALGLILYIWWRDFLIFFLKHLFSTHNFYACIPHFLKQTCNIFFTQSFEPSCRKSNKLQICLVWETTNLLWGLLRIFSCSDVQADQSFWLLQRPRSAHTSEQLVYWNSHRVSHFMIVAVHRQTHKSEN